MAGLVPAIHAFLAQSPEEDVDARDKREHDDGERWFDRTETCSDIALRLTRSHPVVDGIGMSFLAFFEQLAESPWSVSLHESEIAYSLIESSHVWSLAVFFGLTVMFDLRLLGWTMRKVPITEFANRVLPWTIAAFVVMVISGTLLFYAIPLRSYQNIFFRFKMILLLLAGLNVWIFHSRVYPKVATADVEGAPPKGARVAGALSLLLWIGVVVSGRMIAYNWFDCDRQPQTDIINFLTSCVPTE
jgi:hypothetical protein